jgi:hypothetical protein
MDHTWKKPTGLFNIADFASATSDCWRGRELESMNAGTLDRGTN